MSRFVSTVAGGDWEWKYAFAEQCSNFGEYAEYCEGFWIYRGEDGEYIKVFGERDAIVDALDELIEELLERTHCDCCGSGKCIRHTAKMFENFRDFIADNFNGTVDVLLFSEYG